MMNHLFFMSIIAGYVLLMAQYRSDQRLLNDTRLNAASKVDPRRLSYYRETARENAGSGQEMRSREGSTRRDTVRDVRQSRVGEERSDRIRSDPSVSRRELSVLRDVENQRSFNDLRDTRMHNREEERGGFDERSHRLAIDERLDQRRLSNYRKEGERHLADVRDQSQRRLYDVREEDESRASHVRGQDQRRLSSVREEDQRRVSQTRDQERRVYNQRSRNDELNLNRERSLREVRNDQRVRDTRNNRREETRETRRLTRLGQETRREESSRFEMSRREKDTRVRDDVNYRIKLENKPNTKSDLGYNLSLINWTGLMTMLWMCNKKQVREKVRSFTHYITI